MKFGIDPIQLDLNGESTFFHCLDIIKKNDLTTFITGRRYLMEYYRRNFNDIQILNDSDINLSIKLDINLNDLAAPSYDLKDSVLNELLKYDSIIDKTDPVLIVARERGENQYVEFYRIKKTINGLEFQVYDSDEFYINQTPSTPYNKRIEFMFDEPNYVSINLNLRMLSYKSSHIPTTSELDQFIRYYSYNINEFSILEMLGFMANHNFDYLDMINKNLFWKTINDFDTETDIFKKIISELKNYYVGKSVTDCYADTSVTESISTFSRNVITLVNKNTGEEKLMMLDADQLHSRIKTHNPFVKESLLSNQGSTHSYRNIPIIDYGKYEVEDFTNSELIQLYDELSEKYLQSIESFYSKIISNWMPISERYSHLSKVEKFKLFIEYARKYILPVNISDNPNSDQNKRISFYADAGTIITRITKMYDIDLQRDFGVLNYDTFMQQLDSLDFDTYYYDKRKHKLSKTESRYQNSHIRQSFLDGNPLHKPGLSNNNLFIIDDFTKTAWKKKARHFLANFFQETLDPRKQVPFIMVIQPRNKIELMKIKTLFRGFSKAYFYSEVCKDIKLSDIEKPENTVSMRSKAIKVFEHSPHARNVPLYENSFIYADQESLETVLFIDYMPSKNIINIGTKSFDTKRSDFLEELGILTKFIFANYGKKIKLTSTRNINQLIKSGLEPERLIDFIGNNPEVVSQFESRNVFAPKETLSKLEVILNNIQPVFNGDRYKRFRGINYILKFLPVNIKEIFYFAYSVNYPFRGNYSARRQSIENAIPIDVFSNGFFRAILTEKGLTVNMAPDIDINIVSQVSDNNQNLIIAMHDIIEYSIERERILYPDNLLHIDRYGNPTNIPAPRARSADEMERALNQCSQEQKENLNRLDILFLEKFKRIFNI